MEHPRPGLPARTLAVLGGLALVAAAFLPWVERGTVALDLGITGVRGTHPTIAVLLVALAALPSVAALVDDVAWPRWVSAALTGALILGWLGFGPDGSLVAGVATAIAGAVTMFVAAGLGRVR